MRLPALLFWRGCAGRRGSFARAAIAAQPGQHDLQLLLRRPRPVLPLLAQPISFRSSGQSPSRAGQPRRGYTPPHLSGETKDSECQHRNGVQATGRPAAPNPARVDHRRKALNQTRMHKGQATGYPTQADTGAPCVLASRRPAHPDRRVVIPKRVLTWSKESRGDARPVGVPLGLEQRMVLSSDGGSG